jgi:hypothetical protein
MYDGDPAAARAGEAHAERIIQGARPRPLAEVGQDGERRAAVVAIEERPLAAARDIGLALVARPVRARQSRETDRLGVERSPAHVRAGTRGWGRARAVPPGCPQGGGASRRALPADGGLAEVTAFPRPPARPWVRWAPLSCWKAWMADFGRWRLVAYCAARGPVHRRGK